MICNSIRGTVRCLHQNHQFQFGPARKVERDLLETELAAHRMREGAQAALTADDGLLLPRRAEDSALPAELADQRVHLGIVEVPAMFEAEFRQQAACPLLP